MNTFEEAFNAQLEQGKRMDGAGGGGGSVRESRVGGAVEGRARVRAETLL